jgi:peptidoglycan/LPS O-acetylase OafA/YrhL
MKKRNSLIELYRLLFALNVVKNHGFFPEGIPYFGPGRVSVEFFFILSGFLFVRTLEQGKDAPLKTGLGKVLIGKTKPLLIPLIIGLVCNLACNLVSGAYFDGIWGYLWYVHSMLVVFMGYVALRKWIKSDQAFWGVVIGVFAVATTMRFSGIFYSWGNIRAAAALSLGMLLTKLPPIRLKHQNLLWLVLVPVQAACLAIVGLMAADAEILGGFRWLELLMDTVLYPALIYFTFQLKFHSGVLNYLGGLSFGLYAFQCPADLLRTLGFDNRIWLLLFIIAAAVLEDGGKRIWRFYKNHRTGKLPA